MKVGERRDKLSNGSLLVQALRFARLRPFHERVIENNGIEFVDTHA